MLVTDKEQSTDQYQAEEHLAIKVIDIKVTIKAIVPVYIKQSAYIEYIDWTQSPNRNDQIPVII